MWDASSAAAFPPLSEISDLRGGVKLLDDRNQRALEVDQGQAPLMAEYRAINISALSSTDLPRNLRQDYP